MKRFALALLALMQPAAAAADEAWRDKAVDLIRKEKKVVEAMFTQNISLWVSVRDDGTNRDGYADYICLVLGDAGMPKGDFVIIRILDAAALAKEEMKELGRSECAPS